MCNVGNSKKNTNKQKSRNKPVLKGYNVDFTEHIVLFFNHSHIREN